TSFLKLATVQHKDKQFTLKPGRCAITCFAGFSIATICIIYAISQSYKGQEIPAFGVGFFFTMASVYYYYAHFLQKIAFNTEKITIQSPFRSAHSFNWTDLDGVELRSNLKIIFQGKKHLTISGHLDGVEQLYNLICTELSGFDNIGGDTADSSRSFAFFKAMEGKKILIGISHVTEDLIIGKLTQLHGTAQSVDENRLKIILKGTRFEEDFILPADPYAFIEVDEDEITLSSTNETIQKPNFIAEYYTMDNKWA
ncbi:MAG: hypothetical protein KUG81_08325, partial [Gammaproteobacteria bacterium]|nr:hypothetical protein [Gammaproteobacteria bacterium]